MIEHPSRVAVLGAGAWGTAMALVIARAGHSVTLWSHSEGVADAIRTRHENTRYLPGIPIPTGIAVTHDIAVATLDAAIIVSVVPSHAVREVYSQLCGCLRPEQLIVSATKGIEDKTCKRVSEVIIDEIGPGARIGVLSGPSFAQEVAAGLPTALTIASADAELAQRVQHDFSGPVFRLYTNDDVAGVELGGALKNVMALAAGIANGLQLGHNSIAALITRGTAETTRLAVACGARRETLAGLAGLGDLVLTCTGSLSRNRHVGTELGRGKRLHEILAAMNGKVAEGVLTTAAALGLARTHGVEMPITQQIDAILHHGRSPQDAMRELMARPGKDE
jgi:glycerol-3-phosphate dehydrogenase (NAD(P)+)